jgi:hypothetical protein
MNKETFRVNGCDLCKIFNELDIHTKLYYPDKNKILEFDDFVILDCETCKVPMVVVSDHVTEIGKEQWGRILYRCKLLFGDSVKLRTKTRKIKDHWHAHLYSYKNVDKLPNLNV